MDDRIHLSLQGAEAAASPADSDKAAPRDYPAIGYLAVACGLLSIVGWGVVFVPMGIAFAISALIVGQGGWGFGGLVLTIVGLVHSPVFVSMLGISTLLHFMGFPGF